MRTFVGRLNHRDSVQRNLEALLLLYPPKRQFADDFPELKATIRADYDGGMPAPDSALNIAARIIGGFLAQLAPAEKSAALEALVDGGRARFAEIARYRVKGAREANGTKEASADRVVFATRLTGVAIYMAGRMAEEGALRRDAYEAFVAALEMALGADVDQPLAHAFAC